MALAEPRNDGQNGVLQQAVADTISGVLARASELWRDDFALVDGQHRLTYRQLHASVVTAANDLDSARLTRGARIAIWAPNSVNWVLAALAAAHAGAVRVPINTRCRGAEAADILQRCSSTIAIGSAARPTHRTVTVTGWNPRARCSATARCAARPVTGAAASDSSAATATSSSAPCSAVIGVPDDRLGEVDHAFVVAREGRVIDEGELLAWCREQMANYKVPRKIIVCDTLPLTASGQGAEVLARAAAAAAA